MPYGQKNGIKLCHWQNYVSFFCGRIFFPDYLETLIELKEHQSLN